MDKNIRSIFSPDEAVSFRVVKPFYGSLHLDLPPDVRFKCFTYTVRELPDDTVDFVERAECTRMKP